MTRRCLFTVLQLGLLVSLVIPVHAQHIEVVDDAKLPRFEVVSVKPGDPNADRAMIGTPPGRFVQQNMPMTNAVSMAFGLGFTEAAGVLTPVLRERYSIEARMPADARPADLGLMIRALLVDRFKLRYHVETREVDGFNLVVMRPDRRLGPNLRASTVDCRARMEAQRRQQPLDPQPAGTKPCGINNGPGSIDFGGMPLATLVQMLSNQAGAPVVDKTGLSENYDIELHWSLAVSAALRAGTPPPDDGPSIFTAVQEQLGLKLEAARTPRDVVVIDHAERPDAD